jgi:hypothetical protein
MKVVIQVIISIQFIFSLRADLYTGPPLPAWEGIDPSWVPIVPVTSRWDDKTGKPPTRAQLPLTPAWAITIHKSQGLTLKKAVIDLGENDFPRGFLSLLYHESRLVLEYWVAVRASELGQPWELGLVITRDC